MNRTRLRTYIKIKRNSLWPLNSIYGRGEEEVGSNIENG